MKHKLQNNKNRNIKDTEQTAKRIKLTHALAQYMYSFIHWLKGKKNQVFYQSNFIYYLKEMN